MKEEKLFGCEFDQKRKKIKKDKNYFSKLSIKDDYLTADDESFDIENKNQTEILSEDPLFSLPIGLK